MKSNALLHQRWPRMIQSRDQNLAHKELLARIDVHGEIDRVRVVRLGLLKEVYLGAVVALGVEVGLYQVAVLVNVESGVGLPNPGVQVGFDIVQLLRGRPIDGVTRDTTL